MAAITFSVDHRPGNELVFLYAQNILRVPGYATAAMVVGAGLAGLGGLVLGQWLADHRGRRPAVSIGIVGVGSFGLVNYAGSTAALLCGYVLGVLAGSVLAPGIGSLLNELFPTSVRSSVSGWWVAAGVIGAATGLMTFGAITDVSHRFGLAALVIFLPATAAVAGLVWLVPETCGREPEQLWP